MLTKRETTFVNASVLDDRYEFVNDTVILNVFEDSKPTKQLTGIRKENVFSADIFAYKNKS